MSLTTTQPDNPPTTCPDCGEDHNVTNKEALEDILRGLDRAMGIDVGEEARQHIGERTGRDVENDGAICMVMEALTLRNLADRSRKIRTAITAFLIAKKKNEVDLLEFMEFLVQASLVGSGKSEGL